MLEQGREDIKMKQVIRDKVQKCKNEHMAMAEQLKATFCENGYNVMMTDDSSMIRDDAD